MLAHELHRKSVRCGGVRAHGLSGAIAATAYEARGESRRNRHASPRITSKCRNWTSLQGSRTAPISIMTSYLQSSRFREGDASGSPRLRAFQGSSRGSAEDDPAATYSAGVA